MNFLLIIGPWAKRQKECWSMHLILNGGTIMGRVCSKTKKETPEQKPELQADAKRPDYSKKVAVQVEAQLGTPDNLDRIMAIDIDPDNYFRSGNRYYRVNVAVQVSNLKGLTLGEKFKPIYPHSFYVITDENGIIISSKPEIERHYPEKVAKRTVFDQCCGA